jgi:hypothetical protein
MRLMSILVVVAQLATISAGAQSSNTVLAGKWTYRSFHNDPAPVADDPKAAPEKALALIFAEAVFTFEVPSSTTLKGAIDWPGGGLDLYRAQLDRGSGVPLRSLKSLGQGGPAPKPQAGNTTIAVNLLTNGRTASIRFLRSLAL